MTARIERILTILDAGLQHSAESGSRIEDRPRCCVRCQVATAPPGRDFCRECRAFLRGTTDGTETAAETDAELPMGQLEFWF